MSCIYVLVVHRPRAFSHYCENLAAYLTEEAAIESLNDYRDRWAEALQGRGYYVEMARTSKREYELNFHKIDGADGLVNLVDAPEIRSIRMAVDELQIR